MVTLQGRVAEKMVRNAGTHFKTDLTFVTFDMWIGSGECACQPVTQKSTVLASTRREGGEAEKILQASTTLAVHTALIVSLCPKGH